MRDPKNGTVRATMIVLNTKAVLIRRLNNLLLQQYGNQFSVAFTIGTTINAYLDMGLTRVVYMATLELSFSIGRFKVICDCTSEPNIKYPKTAIAA